MIDKEILVLANSIKHGQHCVAGKCMRSGIWIRPVSDQQGAELSHEQARYRNPYGTFAVKPLQRIKMEFSHHVPLAHQPDNYLIGSATWRQNYSVGLSSLHNYLDCPEDLWGEANRVLHERVVSGDYNIHQSLYLVRVENLILHYAGEGKRRASFKYNEIEYNLAVTDPNFDQLVSTCHEMSGIICVSLGEEYNGYCYKLVATVF